MTKEQLQVFARVKPSPDKLKVPYTITSQQTISMDINRNKMSNAKDHYEFHFQRAFNEEIDQCQIFDSVAKPVLDNCLEGYNGTIFAYGQTGSGKTYTMSGGQKWGERGIIPRVLSYVFQKFKEKQHSMDYTLNVSFIEIYNENAYDLLNENHNEGNFQSWTKIVFMQDQQNNLKMKNVKVHGCETEEQGLDFLMMGNYNRKINATSMNQTSSRSHCIFTLNIRGTEKKTLLQVYSKIHLVDLAGSERISKSQAEGIVLTEAKSINLSLSYLEQVIVSLNQKLKSKSKQHVPYRNSLLTTLLKDSLGGNCKTVMIANISMEQSNTDETISTLRFSQRVSKIQNQVVKNQRNIYSNQIQSLEKQNMILKRKLAKYEKQNQRPGGDQETEQELRLKVQNFMRDKNSGLNISSLNQAAFCFKEIKDIYTKKMREYATQLTFIHQKMEKYNEILAKKTNSRRNLFE